LALQIKLNLDLIGVLKNFKVVPHKTIHDDINTIVGAIKSRNDMKEPTFLCTTTITGNSLPYKKLGYGVIRVNRLLYHIRI